MAGAQRGTHDAATISDDENLKKSGKEEKKSKTIYRTVRTGVYAGSKRCTVNEEMSSSARYAAPPTAHGRGNTSATWQRARKGANVYCKFIIGERMSVSTTICRGKRSSENTRRPSRAVRVREMGRWLFEMNFLTLCSVFFTPELPRKNATQNLSSAEAEKRNSFFLFRFSCSSSWERNEIFMRNQ